MLTIVTKSLGACPAAALLVRKGFCAEGLSLYGLVGRLPHCVVALLPPPIAAPRDLLHAPLGGLAWQNWAPFRGLRRRRAASRSLRRYVAKPPRREAHDAIPGGTPT
ncbi:uncharacterized protein Tco025E_07027 [Trypanosoma conorhini]|uniref:Uncharacterized protein n=1 Tax=Trypanosoma conorhini TaxID=83891 RepID=A0A422NV13_9TRYP|nr:uncharacterized protein Tco025E_07027 [Trypanosoma conorhini]RNF09289.1 hypothetical protein Tco025E_07027 [Trypanosoma conorhini]